MTEQKQFSSLRKTMRTQTTLANPGVGGSRLAMHTSLSISQSTSTLDAILKSGHTRGSAAISGEYALKEVECAREFNFELPEDIAASVEMLEQAVLNVTGTQKCAILTFDETSGVYSCLNDLKAPGTRGSKVRELTRIADCFLQELIGTNSELIHSYLLLENHLVGMVVVTDKADGSSFTLQDQMALDILAPYLAVKVVRFQNLKASLTVPYIQSQVLELAGQLVMAVDQDAIVACVLELFANKLGFDTCQFVGFNPDSGVGEVLYEIAADGHVQSYSHAGLEGKRRTLSDYANLVGLLSSMARNRFYLQLDGKTLGDRPLSEIFGLESIQSALLLPVLDTATGEIRGTFNLFHTSAAAIISDEARQIAREAALLTSRALSRSMVLEKALAMASSDELTGLINRRGFYQRFEAEIERARRHQTPLCVALIDVDHFKHFNDTYGHLSGDLVLKALSDLFMQNVRKSDVVCRFGGEEFAILLPDTALKAGADLMERVRQKVEKMQLRGLNGEELHVTISVGLAAVDGKPKNGAHRSEISEALALADEQLYAAKGNGRNQVCYIEGAEDEPAPISQVS